MIEGVFTFASHVEGVELESVSIPSSNPSITKIELSSSSQGDLRLGISMPDTSDQIEARAIAIREAGRIADRLANQTGT